MRKIIQFILSVFFMIVGFPSKGGVISLVAKELLCDPNINQCTLGITIATSVFVLSLVSLIELGIETFS